MSYSDIQMIIASQIAYMDFDKDAVDAGTYTVRDLLELEIDSGDPTRIDTAEKLLERINEHPDGRECGDWIVRDICNEQHSSGMYACMIDTGDNEALIAFRGSESDTLENLVKDWGFSDIGLLNNILTPQQATAEAYIKEIYNKYGQQYDNFGVTGHSLGGNLAEHATITAPDNMRDKISQCVNLDGPGYSANYILAHASDIKKSEGLISHYQWSIIGTLLTPVPGTDVQTIAAETPDKGWYLKSLLYRHDTYNVTQFDKNGNVLSGKRDELASWLGPMAKVIDYSIFALFNNPINALLHDGLDKLQDDIRNLWDMWNEYRSSGRRVEFEINPHTVNGGISRLETLAAEMERIAAEVERVEKSLSFESLSSGYIKMKLWSISNSVENNVNKLERCCEKGRDCVQIYHISEKNIVNNYE